MRNLIIVLVLTLSVLSCKNETKKDVTNQHKNHIKTSDKKEAPKKKVLSPQTSAMEMIGNAHIHIDYSSPGVRGRIIFGGLVGYDNVWQAGAILLPVQSVGVMGDERTYEFTIALRCVNSVDGMTAEWSPLPHEFLAKVSSEIINKIKGINRVVYDISTKPPATIEWE